MRTLVVVALIIRTVEALLHLVPDGVFVDVPIGIGLAEHDEELLETGEPVRFAVGEVSEFSEDRVVWR